jgi:hypothetical protein
MTSFEELLVKAVRGLPADEQDTVLQHLLQQQTGRAPQPWSRQGPWGQVFGSGELGWLRGGERTGGNWQVVPVRLSAEQHETLKQWCEDNDFSMAVVVRGLVDRFLSLQKRSGGADPGADPA